MRRYALWVIEIGRQFSDANLALKEQILEQTRSVQKHPWRLSTGDKLLNFLKGL